MKGKILFAILLCLFGFTQVSAQVTFKPGVKAGANFSHFTQTGNPSERYYTKTDFYLGLLAEIKLSKFYTMQPEVLYSRQGSGFEYIGNDNVRYDDKINISYLSLGLANKFTFDKINVHVGSTFDIKINDAKKEITGYNEYNDYYYDYENSIDLAFFIGAGYSITDNLQIEARAKKGIVPLNGDWDSQNVVFQVGLSYTFTTK